MFTPAGRVDGNGNDMSACCSTYGNVAGAHFGEKIAKRDLASYRKKGPGPTARLLRDLLVGTGAVGGVLLDVGSGVGGLSFELLDRGAERVIAVDASPAYLAAAAQEATRRDRLGVVKFMHGDFVEVGPQLPSATIVTLDRVICCYASFEPLLNEAFRHAEHAFVESRRTSGVEETGGAPAARALLECGADHAPRGERIAAGAAKRGRQQLDVSPARIAHRTGQRSVENAGTRRAAGRERNYEQGVYDSSANSSRSALPQSRSRS